MKEKNINIIQILFYIILSTITMIMIFFTGLGIDYLIREANDGIKILDILKIIIYFFTMCYITIKMYNKCGDLIEEFSLHFIRKDHERSIDKGPIYFCINLSKMSYYMDEETCRHYMSDIYNIMKHLPVTIYTYEINYNEWNY